MRSPEPFRAALDLYVPLCTKLRAATLAGRLEISWRFVAPATAGIYAIYGRALRENPALQGKVVFEITIALTC